MIITTVAGAHSVKDGLEFPALLIAMKGTDVVSAYQVSDEKEFLTAVQQFLAYNLSHVVVTGTDGEPREAVPAPEPRPQSPMYEDARAILREIDALQFEHSKILALMNWKLRRTQ
jgi:hypothetical protein